MEETPGSSSTANDEFHEHSMHNAVAKRQLKDAFVYCDSLLQEADLIDTESSATISEDAIAIGEELYQSVIEMLGEKVLITDEDLIHFEEVDEEGLFREVDGYFSDDEDYEPVEKKTKAGYVPLETKIKVVRLAKAHPTWNLQTLQIKGSRSLKRKDDLKRWEENIKTGGTTIDKYSIIDSWTNDRFVEARKTYQQVTTRNLQEWALAAAGQFQSEGFIFKASLSWIKKFKQRHRIRQRKITRYVSNRESVTLEETQEAARKFQLQTKAIIPNFDKKFVINTYPTGSQYQSTYDRTLAEKNSKTVFVKRRDMNKVTHSYTAQYAITMSGELLPQVFLCLQEATGNLGPRVQKTVENSTKDLPNVVVTSSKSGKLTTQLYNLLLTSVVLPYVKKEKFLLIIDSWGGQTNPGLYDEIFTNDTGLGICTVKVIPPKCTPLCQPCEVYFYRQVKNFIKRLQNCSYLIENKREIASREDAIKIHSIVHHQLSAPIFTKMLRYAWFASKLSEEREIFQNVNEVCFSMETLKIPCACGKIAFIRCSRCRFNLCFPCLYEKYHPATCNVESTSDD